MVHKGTVSTLSPTESTPSASANKAALTCLTRNQIEQNRAEPSSFLFTGCRRAGPSGRSRASTSVGVSTSVDVRDFSVSSRVLPGRAVRREHEDRLAGKLRDLLRSLLTLPAFRLSLFMAFPFPFLGLGRSRGTSPSRGAGRRPPWRGQNSV